MIKKQAAKDGTTKVTFSLSLNQAPDPTSVVGDFNDWNPLETPLKKRSNGTRSASIVVPSNQTLRFKYLTDGGHWSTDNECGIDETGDSIFSA